MFSSFGVYAILEFKW